MKVISGSRRPAVALGSVIALLLCAGGAAAQNVASGEPPTGELIVGAEVLGTTAEAGTEVSLAPGPEETVPAPPPVLPPPPEVITTTTAPAPAPTSTAVPTTVRPSSTSTTAGRPTTTRRPPTTSPGAPTAGRGGVVPASGPPRTSVILWGSPCDTGFGFGISMKDATGRSYPGDGGSLTVDGSWAISVDIPHDAPLGTFTFTAVCLAPGSVVRFRYPLAVFNVTDGSWVP